mmetsp:Transcript_6848/g.10068  ORF Transcript_6848/g.10068 Transcript_6848/m.10068 type:complete len:405 (-) Transcript_6848:7-1221(-)
MGNSMSAELPETMLALKIDSDNPKGKVTEVPIPEPQPGEALIKVLRAGVCNTDLEIQKGYMGFQGILGHEFVGIVHSVNGSAAQRDAWTWIGKRVCGDINICCQSCDICSLGTDRSRNHCPNRTVLGILNKDGTMAEYLTLPINNLHEVPENVSDGDAVFAEPLAAACRIVEQNVINFDEDRVAILGDGKLGLMIAEVLGREFLKAQDDTEKSKGVEGKSVPKPLLLGKHANKMKLVEESGVQCRNISDCKDEEGNIRPEYTQQFDVVIDATGNSAGIAISTSLTRPMGTIVLKSTCASGDLFNAAPFVIDELKVVGSRCGPFPKALQLLSISDDSDETNDDGSAGCCQASSCIKGLNATKYITRYYPLSQAEEALAFAAERSTMKVQIICSPLGEVIEENKVA